MTADQALADLMEISSQVRAAVLVSPAGDVEAATAGGESLARPAQQLLEAAVSVRPGGGEQPVTQLEAATRGGSIFVVASGGRMIAAATAQAPTVGLVFYDLKTCLRSLSSDAEPEAAAPEADEKKKERSTKATAVAHADADETA